MKNANDHEFYLVDELAEKLRVNRMTIYRYIKAGRLQAFKTGKEYRIAKVEFDRFLNQVKTNNAMKNNAKKNKVTYTPEEIKESNEFAQALADNLGKNVLAEHEQILKDLEPGGRLSHLNDAQKKFLRGELK